MLPDSEYNLSDHKDYFKMFYNLYVNKCFEYILDPQYLLFRFVKSEYKNGDNINNDLIEQLKNEFKYDDLEFVDNSVVILKFYDWIKQNIIEYSFHLSDTGVYRRNTTAGRSFRIRDFLNVFSRVVFNKTKIFILNKVLSFDDDSILENALSNLKNTIINESTYNVTHLLKDNANHRFLRK